MRLGFCPICNGKIIETKKTFSCENAIWKFEETFDSLENHGCQFYIHKEIFKKYGCEKITKKNLMDLNNSGFFTIKLRNKYKQDYFKNVYISEEFGLTIDFEKEISV